MSAQHHPGPTVLVFTAVSDKAVHYLTGADPTYYDSTGNVRDAQVIRERAQRMWDVLIAMNNSTGSN